MPLSKLTLLIITALALPGGLLLKVQDKVEEYLREPFKSKTKLKELVESGTVGGFMSTADLLTVFHTLSQRFPKLISESEIGKTTLGKSLMAYTLMGDTSALVPKSKILFTALHHPRELLCGNMILTLFVDTLHDLIHSKASNQYWQFNDIIFVPIVSLDTHALITESWATDKWSQNQSLRKNRNEQYCGADFFSMGVDLNRNYGYHYGSERSDKEECNETFRGPFPFSEKETQAVKGLVEGEPRITTAMNFHSYGNIWIHPFNYMTTVEGYPPNTDPQIVNFYEAFQRKVGLFSQSQHGNALKTIGYSSSGEASDWMLGEQKIVSFSPELGSSDHRTNTFFFEQSLIFNALEENYRVIRVYLDMNRVQLVNFSYALDNKSVLTLQFDNEGLSELYDGEVECFVTDRNFAKSIASVKVEPVSGDVQRVAITARSDLEFSFPVKRLHKLSHFKVSFEFSNPNYLSLNFDLSLKVKSASGMVVASFDVLFKNPADTAHLIIGFSLVYLLVMLVSGIVVMRKLRPKVEAPVAQQTVD